MLGRRWSTVKCRQSSRKRNLKHILQFYSHLQIVQRSFANDWSDEELDAMFFACEEMQRIRLLFRHSAQDHFASNLYRTAERYGAAFQHILPDDWKGQDKQWKRPDSTHKVEELQKVIIEATRSRKLQNKMQLFKQAPSRQVSNAFSESKKSINSAKIKPVKASLERKNTIQTIEADTPVSRKDSMRVKLPLVKKLSVNKNPVEKVKAAEQDTIRSDSILSQPLSEKPAPQVAPPAPESKRPQERPEVVTNIGINVLPLQGVTSLPNQRPVQNIRPPSLEAVANNPHIRQALQRSLLGGQLEGGFGSQQQRVQETVRLAKEIRSTYWRSFKEIQTNFNEINMINEFWNVFLKKCMQVPDLEQHKSSSEQQLNFLGILENISAKKVHALEAGLALNLKRFFYLSANEGPNALADCERKGFEFIKNSITSRTIYFQKIHEIIPTLTRQNLAKLTTYLLQKCKILCQGAREPAQVMHAKLLQTLQPPEPPKPPSEDQSEEEQILSESSLNSPSPNEVRGDAPPQPTPGVWKLSTQYQTNLQTLARELNVDGGSLRYERSHVEPSKTTDYTQAIIGSIGALNDKSMKRQFWDRVSKTFFNDLVQERSVERLHSLIKLARQEQMHIEQNLTFSALMARQRTQDEKRFEHLLSNFLRKRGALDNNIEPLIEKKKHIPCFLRDDSELPTLSLESMESTFRNGLIEGRNDTRGSTSHSEEGIKKESPPFYNSDSSSSDDDSYLYETLSDSSRKGVKRKEFKEDLGPERKHRALDFCMKAICRASFHGQKKSILASKFLEQPDTIVINKKQPHHRRIHNEDEEESGMRETDFNDELSFTLKLLIEEYLQAKDRNIGELEGLVHKVVKDTPEMKKIKSINIDHQAKEVKSKMQQHKRKREKKRGEGIIMPTLKITVAPDTQKSVTPTVKSPHGLGSSQSEWGGVSKKRPPEQARASPTLLEKRRSYAKPSSHSRMSFKQLPGKSQPEPLKQYDQTPRQCEFQENGYSNEGFLNTQQQQDMQSFYRAFQGNMMLGMVPGSENCMDVNQMGEGDHLGIMDGAPYGEQGYVDEHMYNEYEDLGIMQGDQDECYQVGIRHSVPPGYVQDEEEEGVEQEGMEVEPQRGRSPPYQYFGRNEPQHSPRLFSHITYHRVQE